MTSLIYAVVFFVGLHWLVSGTPLRGVLLKVLGEKPYMAVYSLLSVAGLVWMIWAYANAPESLLWGSVDSNRWLALSLVWLALLFVVSGMMSANPTAVGGESLINAGKPVQGITRITRHPFLFGFALWSLVHVIYNGDQASLIFFGGFFLLSVVGPSSIDHKQKAALGEPWREFAKQTSVVPFLAITTGRNQLKLSEIGMKPVLVATLVFALFAVFHQRLFGVSPW